MTNRLPIEPDRPIPDMLQKAQEELKKKIIDNLAGSEAEYDKSMEEAADHAGDTSDQVIRLVEAALSDLFHLLEDIMRQHPQSALNGMARALTSAAATAYVASVVPVVPHTAHKESSEALERVLLNTSKMFLVSLCESHLPKGKKGPDSV